MNGTNQPYLVPDQESSQLFALSSLPTMLHGGAKMSKQALLAKSEFSLSISNTIFLSIFLSTLHPIH